MTPVDNLPEITNPTEVAKFLNLDRAFIMRELRNGNMGHYRLSPKRILINKTDVMEYLKKCRREIKGRTSNSEKTAIVGKSSSISVESSNVTQLALAAVKMQKKNLLK